MPVASPDFLSPVEGKKNSSKKTNRGRSKAHSLGEAQIESLRDLPTGNMYLLLSGRWFRSKSEDGPWTFVRADELPPAFAEIPPASDLGGLRTSVAGTPEAEEAVLDAHIPQTAAIA